MEMGLFMHKIIWIIIVITGLSLSQVIYGADTTVNNKNTPVPSSISPSLSIGSGSDVCVVVRSGAVQSSIIGISGGVHVTDPNCIMLKNARMLASLGVKVSALALMCRRQDIWESFIMSGTPCPYYGKIGDEAIAEYKKIGRLNEDGSINYSWNPVNALPVVGRANDIGQPVK
tara:strand:- start:1141 stop:1659 length:519 start_codon:yes stop_codon:yes gene_type:complete